MGDDYWDIGELHQTYKKIVSLIRTNNWIDFDESKWLECDVKEKEVTWVNQEERDKAIKVAEATLNALEKGHTIEQLIKRNTSVRVFYNDMKTREEKAAKAAILEAARKQKAEEAKAAKEAAKAEIMSRLTPEELEAFGLNKVSKSKKR